MPTTSQPWARIVAPVSTVLFVPRSHQPGSPFDESIPKDSNIPAGKHWTDLPAPGTVVVLSQPAGQICAVLGDIIGGRLKYRGLKGVVADGRVRDIVDLGKLCEDGKFQVWSRGISTVGTGLEAKPWCVDVPVRIGEVEVRAGDVVVMEKGERGAVVIPREKLQEAVDMLPGLKEADDNVVKDVQAGVDLSESFKRHRGHYTQST